MIFTEAYSSDWGIVFMERGIYWSENGRERVPSAILKGFFEGEFGNLRVILSPLVPPAHNSIRTLVCTRLIH